MKNLKNKLSKKGGFTLVEMLIVVAIIAILVAVSIPLINTSLDNAREQTDAANFRAAKAEGAIVYLNSAFDANPPTGVVGYRYDAANGKLIAEGESLTDVDLTYGKYNNHTFIYVTIDFSTGVVTANWN